MKEYSITLTINVESRNMNYDDMVDYANEFAENIIEEMSNKRVNITDAIVESVEDLNDYDVDVDYDE